MSIFLDKLALDLGGHGPGKMHLHDPLCTGRNYNDTHYRLFTSYGRCGTTFEVGHYMSHSQPYPSKPRSPDKGFLTNLVVGHTNLWV